MWRNALVGIVVAAGLASSPAMACKGTTVLLEDDFKTIDPAWATDSGLVIAAGQAKLTAPTNGVLRIFYNGSLFQDSDACVDVTLPTTSVSGGIIFWAQDIQNFYAYLVSGAGHIGVVRMQNGKWLYPVSMRSAEGVKTEAGSVNALRVVLQGMSGTAYINDKTFITFKGQPPQGGGFIGLYGESDQNNPTAWLFSNLKVTSAPSP